MKDNNTEKQPLFLNNSGGSVGLGVSGGGTGRMDSFNKQLKVKTSFLNNLSGTISTKATGGADKVLRNSEGNGFKNLLSTS